MFNCKISADKVKWFKEVIKTIKGGVDEIKIEVNEKGLIFKNLDRSHIMYVFLELKPKFFETFIYNNIRPVGYTATIGELLNVLCKHAIQEKFDEDTGELYLAIPVDYMRDSYYWQKLSNNSISRKYAELVTKFNSFWLDTDELNQVMQRLKTGDTVCLSENESSFIIDITGKSSKQFSIYKLDHEYDVGHEPDLPDLNAVRLNYAAYDEAIRDIKLTKYNDKIWVSLEEDKLRLFVEGKKGDTTIKIDADIARADSNLKVKSCYSLDRIVKAISGLKDYKTELILEFATDTPIRSIYPVTDDTGFFKCLIAPRIESEE